MDVIQYVLLWGTGLGATYLYLFRWDLHVLPTSLVALASWVTLVFRGRTITWVSQAERVQVDGTGLVQAFCVFLALISGFVAVAHYLEIYPTEEMVNNPNEGDFE
jgi:cellobiose-specific phosphotransferase system component IIC